MKAHLPALGVFLILVVAASPAIAQEEQWLQYRTSANPQDEGISAGYRWQETSEGPIRDVALPDPESLDVRFARWETPMAKSGFVQLAVARSHAKGDYDRLYVDSNCDGSLEDEKAIAAFSADQYYTRFGPFKIVFAGEDGPITYHAVAECTQYEPENIRIGVRSACWYQGDVKVAEKVHTILLIDYNSNGAFDDTSMDSGEADQIVIREEKRTIRPAGEMGRVIVRQEERTACLGKYIEMDGKLYHPQPARDGAYIVFTAAENVAMGTVVVNDKLTALSLSGINGQLDFELSGGKAQVPAGQWITRNWEIARSDSRGAKWTLSGSYFPMSSVFEVAEGKETALDVGEPVSCALGVTRNADGYTLRAQLEGKLGEYISIKRNGEDPPAPKAHIKNADGSYDKSLPLEYG